jgi:uncharacterized membrane protein
VAELGEALFESRRIEQLSNTIFGVAMTLLAYGFPKEQFSSGAPDWHSIAREYMPHLVALLLSFVVAGLFWFSHQRRLAFAPGLSRASVLVNLLFLLSIVVLPVTTGLYGTYSEAADVALLYAFHLVLIAVLNLVLWWLALSTSMPRDWHWIVAPTAPVVIFIVAAIVAYFAPHAARYAWAMALVVPVIAAQAERRGRRAAER